MPTYEENCQFLYLVLTAAGPPTVDWQSVADELGLSKGAATKRWSRLRQAMQNGADPGPTSYQLLWLTMKHSDRTSTPDWDEIAKKCNTTKGAASKRYSRMKQAFDNGTATLPAASSVSPKVETATKTPKVETPKRKRNAAATANVFSPNADDHDDKKNDQYGNPASPSKRSRVTKKTIKKETIVKEEDNDDEVGYDFPPSSLLGQLEAAVKEVQALHNNNAY